MFNLINYCTRLKATQDLLTSSRPTSDNETLYDELLFRILLFISLHLLKIAAAPIVNLAQWDQMVTICATPFLSIPRQEQQIIVGHFKYDCESPQLLPSPQVSKSWSGWRL